jgi:hypothetical protein
MVCSYVDSVNSAGGYIGDPRKMTFAEMVAQLAPNHIRFCFDNKIIEPTDYVLSRVIGGGTYYFASTEKRACGYASLVEKSHDVSSIKYAYKFSTMDNADNVKNRLKQEKNLIYTITKTNVG